MSQNRRHGIFISFLPIALLGTLYAFAKRYASITISLMNLPAQSCNVSKDFLPVTARSVATRQSHCKRLLRFARNDPLYDDWFLGSGHAITLKYNNYL